MRVGRLKSHIANLFKQSADIFSYLRIIKLFIVVHFVPRQLATGVVIAISDRQPMFPLN